VKKQRFNYVIAKYVHAISSARYLRNSVHYDDVRYICVGWKRNNLCIAHYRRN